MTDEEIKKYRELCAACPLSTLTAPMSLLLDEVERLSKLEQLFTVPVDPEAQKLVDKLLNAARNKETKSLL